MSSPHIFDQEVVARPCRSGCVVHAHVSHLPSQFDAQYGEPGENIEAGWTAQTRSGDTLTWYSCNVCADIVSELDVENHVCRVA